MGIVFSGKVLMIGYGGVASCTLPLVLKHLNIPPSRITVLDRADKRDKLHSFLQQGLQFVQEKICEQNLHTVLQQHVSSGDLIIDLSVNIDTCAIINWCHDHGVLYINTSVEVWEPTESGDPAKRTLYWRQMNIRDTIARWGTNNGPTAVLDHGANPGLVSHFTKQALVDIAEQMLKNRPKDPQRKTLETLLAEEDFPGLAWQTGTKVIHISERDTQIINNPKRPNEFVNTWSVEGLVEEGLAPSELGWGTHEKCQHICGLQHEKGPQNQIYLNRMGIDTWARSWVPQGEIMGMVIRHGEAFTLSDYLTVRENGKAIYRPSVYYVYCPADYTINSLHELKMRQYDLQNIQRIATDEIVDGSDDLGVLLMGHELNAWWTGSCLDIHTARALVPGQNATVLQVACSIIGAILWMIKNPKNGVNIPDQLPYKEILETAAPYLGNVVSRQVDWSPHKDLRPAHAKYGKPACHEEDMWQFCSFAYTQTT